jgi:hypothetical protein
MARHFQTIAASLLTALMAGTTIAEADTLLGTYVARISENDHQASDGYQLDSAAQMVRQDRANWHRFGRGDPEDEDDPFFNTTAARARFEKLLLQAGAMSKATQKAIRNGEPVVEVQVYRQSVKVRIVGN